MTNTPTIRKDIIEALLELYAVATGYPVGLYEGERVIVPKMSRQKFRPYCKKLQGYPEARRACNADHKRRGAMAKKEGFEICHAGLFNYTLPIRIDGKLMGTLLCGQVRLTGSANEIRSLERHKYLVNDLELKAKDRKELERLYRAVEVIDPGQKGLPLLIEQLRVIQTQFYALHSSISMIQQERDLFDRHLENIAHEFQIRLQGMYANSENLWRQMSLGHPISQRMLDDADEILRGVQKLNVLVQNLSLGLGEYEFRSCDLRAIVDESITLYQSEAARKGISFEVEMARSVRLVLSPLHMAHVVNNLVCNAVKYSYKGTSARPRFIRIKGEHQASIYELLVENYGIGVLPEENDLIFEQGYRGMLTRDESRSGAGLGLSIAKYIIQAHDGTIGVVSHNVGSAYITRFTVKLPLSSKRR